MKLSEIEVGKEYVLGRSTWTQTPDRVLIIAKDHPDPGGRKKWNYKTRQNDVIVHKLWGRVFRSYNNYRDSREEAVQPGQITESWADFEARIGEAKTAADAKKVELEAAKNDRVAPARRRVGFINAAFGTKIEAYAVPVSGNGLTAESVWDVFARASEEDLAIIAEYVQANHYPEPVI